MGSGRCERGILSRIPGGTRLRMPLPAVEGRTGNPHAHAWPMKSCGWMNFVGLCTVEQNSTGSVSRACDAIPALPAVAQFSRGDALRFWLTHIAWPASLPPSSTFYATGMARKRRGAQDLPYRLPPTRQLLKLYQSTSLTAGSLRKHRTHTSLLLPSLHAPHYRAFAHLRYAATCRAHTGWRGM